MAVRSLTEIWVDANFKETQLANLRIGQPVDLDVDMYGSHQMFKGRISGFTMGTGSTLALLPAENATGNFVKVVQRLPVRIDLIDYDPDKTPLFIGLSVTPYVHIYEEPTGPNAGKVLQPYPIRRSAFRPPDPGHDRGGRCKSPVARRAINPWLVAVAVVIPTFMEVLDTTIANVALRYIAGGLSAAQRRQRMGHHQLPRRQLRSSCRSPAGSRRGSAGEITSCSRSPYSRSPRRCAAWRQV